MLVKEDIRVWCNGTKIRYKGMMQCYLELEDIGVCCNVSKIRYKGIMQCY